MCWCSAALRALAAEADRGGHQIDALAAPDQRAEENGNSGMPTAPEASA